MSISELNSGLPLQNLHPLQKVSSWAEENATAIKVAKIAFVVLGVGGLASLPFTAPILGAGLIAGLAITGVAILVATGISHYALGLLKIVVPPHHDMKTHIFKPGKCEGGELSYEGDVPILSLESDNPYKAGKAHGYLCGEQISRITERFQSFLPSLRASEAPKAAEAIKKILPPHLLAEMEGMVAGYNQWVSEQPFWRASHKLTLEDVILVHVIPDQYSFDPLAYEKKGGDAGPVKTPRLAVACSSIVERDREKGVVFARNMDCISLGLAGSHSLIIHRKHSLGKHSTVEVGLAGFVGTLTGMNSEGLSLAMNICESFTVATEPPRGMPAAIYNRLCLETCSTVDEVAQFTQRHSPLGAYHLTATDKEEALAFHFYQGPEETHRIRRLEEGLPLYTLNCRYDPEPRCHTHYGEQRSEWLKWFFAHREGRPLEETLSLPFVNNEGTMHKVLMHPRTRTFKVALDNTFAGKAALHSVPTERLFGK